MQALAGTGSLLVIILAVLFAVAPLGVWNRLVKIHRDNKKAAKELGEKLDRLNHNISQLLKAITAE